MSDDESKKQVLQPEGSAGNQRAGRWKAPKATVIDLKVTLYMDRGSYCDYAWPATYTYNPGGEGCVYGGHMPDE